MKVTITRETPVFKGRVFTLVNRDLVFPGGRKSRFNIIKHPGAVAILPILDNGDIMLIRQYRPAIQGYLSEIPAGTREPGESPRLTAGRELIEEIGYRAGKLERIGEFYTAPGFCNESIVCFAATRLAPATAEKDLDEIIRPLRVSYERALGMIRTGRIRDAKTIAALHLAGRFFKRGGSKPVQSRNGRR